MVQPGLCQPTGSACNRAINHRVVRYQDHPQPPLTGLDRVIPFHRTNDLGTALGTIGLSHKAFKRQPLALCVVNRCLHRIFEIVVPACALRRSGADDTGADIDLAFVLVQNVVAHPPITMK